MNNKFDYTVWNNMISITLSKLETRVTHKNGLQKLFITCMTLYKYHIFYGVTL